MSNLYFFNLTNFRICWHYMG